MSESTLSRRRGIFSEAIGAFLKERLQAKLDKLKEGDASERAKLIAQYQPQAWLEDAARRVSQIQAVTHALKPIHPDAKGTNLYRQPAQLQGGDAVGSHLLPASFAADVVGNAAALDVYKLLKLEVDNRSLLDWLLADDAAAIAALSSDPNQGRQWRTAFIGLTQVREDAASSHVRAKQLYWFVGDQQSASDATVDAQYHLLAPLYATSLAHAVYGVLQEDRFGEANKAARQARRDGKLHDGPLRDYPQLAVQKMGGTKPQNISQLNSERGGNNYLLASLPPQWKSRDIRQPWGVQSVFDRMLIRREGVRATLADFLAFLKTDPPANVETRNRVDAYVSDLIDALVTLGGELQRAWPAHWTQDPRCELVREEQLWLDARRAEVDEDFGAEWQRMDWPAQIGKRFGNWLNTQLEKQFAVGDAEQREWAKELLVDESEDGWAQNLHKQRTALNAPHQIPTRLGDQGAGA